MKDPVVVMKAKEQEIVRLKKEIDALRVAARLLREDDDWSFLADPAERQDSWDPIKYIPLREDRNDWFLSMGGEVREVWEQIGNDNWGQQPF